MVTVDVFGGVPSVLREMAFEEVVLPLNIYSATRISKLLSPANSSRTVTLTVTILCSSSRQIMFAQVELSNGLGNHFRKAP